MIKLGQKVRYDPLDSISALNVCEVRTRVIGTVVYINERRGWFCAEYQGLRTTFRFTDIGKSVRIIK